MDNAIEARAIVCAVAVGLTSTLATAEEHVVPLFMSASNALQQGFVRVINHSDTDGTVEIRAVDDTGHEPRALSLSIGAREVVHFNSDDLERGNTDKGITGSTGAGTGDWRLILDSALDIEPLAYVRTEEGFLTSIHDLALVAGTTHYIPTFNPGSNIDQQSVLRLVNPQQEDVYVTINGFDDGNGASASVSLTLAAGHAIRVTAAELEDGPTGSEASGALGDGTGKWRLFVQAQRPIHVMSLLEDPNSYLTNLSASRKTSVQLSTIIVGLPLGEDPDANPIDDVDLTVPAQCANEVEVCVRDEQCVDGDEVRVTINDDVAFEGELFGTWQCEVVSVREGSNSVVFLALNGTGFKGNCVHTNVNTGELRITARGGDENLQSWRHAGGRGSEADLNITLGARSNASCTLPSELDDHSDTISGATDLSPGSSEEGELTSDDVDVFRVDVDGSGTLTVYTTSDIDTVGRLLDNAGGLLSEDDDGGDGRNFRIEQQVDAGTFYVEVRPFSSGGSYTVHADFDGGSTSEADL